MSTLTITINGTAYRAEPGSTVLSVCRENGIDIPTFCYHDALGPYGACRLCVVEAESQALRRTLTTSCNLPAADGMVVETASPRVQLSRKLMFELLLARSPETAAVRQLAARFGITETRFPALSNDDCVKCGRCVRTCRDKMGVSAITFSERGHKRHVTAEFGRLSTLCIGCGACAQVCPTGAIRLEDKGEERKIFLWGTMISRFRLVRCGSCGVTIAPQKYLDAVASRIAHEPGAHVKPLCADCARANAAEALTGSFPAPPAGAAL